MKFIANESLDFQIVRRLRQDGYDVISVAGIIPGIPDNEVLDMANNNPALLMTVGTNFGEPVFR